jgi:predicted transcriptional regulator
LSSLATATYRIHSAVIAEAIEEYLVRRNELSPTTSQKAARETELEQGGWP